MPQPPALEWRRAAEPRDAATHVRQLRWHAGGGGAHRGEGAGGGGTRGDPGGNRGGVLPVQTATQPLRRLHILHRGRRRCAITCAPSLLTTLQTKPGAHSPHRLPADGHLRGLVPTGWRGRHPLHCFANEPDQANENCRLVESPLPAPSRLLRRRALRTTLRLVKGDEVTLDYGPSYGERPYPNRHNKREVTASPRRAPASI